MFLTKDIALLGFWNKILVPFRKAGLSPPDTRTLQPHVTPSMAGLAQHGLGAHKSSCFNLLLATLKMEFLRYLISEWSEFNA